MLLPSSNQARPKLKRPTLILEMLRTVLFVIVVTLLFDLALPRSVVDGNSMQNTFQNNERLFVSRLHYLVTLPERGDIVVFNAVNSDSMLIKRVIGLPGDTVTFTETQVYINGVLIDEPYIREECERAKCPNREYEIPQGEYFVMGDNRNHSTDSRSFGTVPIENIVGRVIFRYFPLNRISLIEHQDYDMVAP